MFPHFLVAIADLTHPLSNNRSSVCIIGCYYVRWTNVVQTTIYPSLTQVEMTMRAPVLIWQFTHLVCIPIAFASLSENHPPLLHVFQTRQKNYKRKQTNTRKTSKQYTRQDIPLYIKVMISLLTSVNGLANSARAAPCCEVVASSLSYPDVWLKQNTLLQACAVKTQKPIHTGLKRNNFFRPR